MAKPSDVQRLREGVEAWNTYRTEEPDRLPDLSHANFWNEDLKGVNLQNVDLQGANLERAKLQGANLSGANLKDARLAQSQLEGSKLISADLRMADLSNANLGDANLADANLQEATLRKTSLRGAFLSNACLVEASLQGAVLARANLRGASLNRAILRNADLRFADLRSAVLHVADLRDVKFQGAKLQGAQLEESKLRRIDLQEVDLKGVKLPITVIEDDYVEREKRRPHFVGKGVNLSRGLDRESTCLGADKYADALATVLNDAEGEVCFALFGHWGRGKTYLMKLVDERLSKEKYECVWFSAWKYRTRPEIWIHLYESLRLKAFGNKNIGVRVARMFRLFLVRDGWNKIFSFISLFIISLIVPWGIVGVAAIPFVLFLGIIFLTKLGISFLGAWNNVSKVTGLSRSSFQIVQHQEKLGLQEVVGKDIQDLLQGWVLSDPDTKSLLEKVISSTKSREAYIYLSLSIVSCAAVRFSFVKIRVQLTSLIAFVDQSLDGFPYGKEVLPFWEGVKPFHFLFLGSDMAPFFLPLILLIAFLFLPVIFHFFDLRKKRILLIVDDLDRLPSDELLDIIESLKLLIEDMSQLMQVVIVCERESLEQAILDKYKSLSSGNSRSERTLIEENMQKLFVSHLHLQALGSDEQEEILRNIIEPENAISSERQEKTLKAIDADINSDETHMQSRDSTPSDDYQPTPSKPKKNAVSDNNDAVFEGMAELTYQEKDSLFVALGTLSKGWVNLGPRAIQSFVFRYKLARELLKARGRTEISASLLAELLAIKLTGGSTNEEALDADIRAVLKEVV